MLQIWKMQIMLQIYEHHEVDDFNSVPFEFRILSEN